MRRTSLSIATLIGLSIAGCSGDGGGDAEQAAPTNASVAVDMPPPAVRSPSAAPDDSSRVPAAVIVSTNEPFYSAWIEGDAMLLEGAGISPRRLSITAVATTPNTRRWSGSDAAGSVTVMATTAACEDSMSGARFPLTGAIEIDGRRAGGCARPAGTPPPPVPNEEGAGAATPMPGTAPTPTASASAEPPATPVATNAVPPAFRGRWAPRTADCRNPAATIEGVTIDARRLLFHESIGSVRSVERIDPNAVRVTSGYEGEGERWTATQTLRLSQAGRRLTIAGPGEPFNRIRCG